jgi:deferrochelatase/peroxidase EfeB
MSSSYGVFCRGTSWQLTKYCSFGFADGISQPAVQGLPTDPNPGHGTPVRQGIILLGRDGDKPNDPNDPTITSRPPWTLDGSFLCFRLLLQRVPEFNAFLKHKATPDVDSELLGARLVGRWKSGMFFLHYCSQVMTGIIMR